MYIFQYVGSLVYKISDSILAFLARYKWVDRGSNGRTMQKPMQ